MENNILRHVSKYLLLCSTEERKYPIWNNMRVSKRWQEFHFLGEISVWYSPTLDLATHLISYNIIYIFPHNFKWRLTSCKLIALLTQCKPISISSGLFALNTLRKCEPKINDHSHQDVPVIVPAEPASLQLAVMPHPKPDYICAFGDEVIALDDPRPTRQQVSGIQKAQDFK